MHWNQKLTEEQERQLVESYIGGTRTGVLVIEFGVSAPTVRNTARKYGHGDYVSQIKGGTRGINTEELNPQIVELHESKLSQQKIADKLGISQAVVSRVLRSAGKKPLYSFSSQVGENNNRWKGGRIITDQDYVMIKTNKYPTMGTKTGYVPEHRLVMAQYMERPLYEWETVHHIDGDKQNNSLANLQLRIGKHGKHEAYKCMDCGSERIEPTKLKTED